MKQQAGPFRRAVVLAVGSGGDVAPMAAIATRITESGLACTLLAPRRYESYVRGTPVEFQSIGADEVFDQVFDGDDLWHPSRGMAASWRYYGAAMRTGLEALRRQGSPADTVLVSSSFAVAARVAEEAYGFLNTTVHLSPSVIFSAIQPPKWPVVSIPAGWPPAWKRLLLAAAERWGTDPVIGEHVNPFQLEHGLMARKRLFSRWIHSPRRVIYAFPEWFAAPAGDWPANGVFAGFPSRLPGSCPMPEELDRFLSQGGGPVVVMTAGTAVASRPQWLRRTMELALEKKARIVVVGPEGGAPIDNPNICRIRFAPFEQLLPKAQLVIHHAGIGTMAAAIRAGIPQLLVPTAHDQPDNAARAERLGIGKIIDPVRDAPGTRSALDWALGGAEMHGRLSATTRRLAAEEDGAQKAAEIVLADIAHPGSRIRRHG